MAPPAPARFSTTNCWPSFSFSHCAVVRAMPSVLPPGANGTIRVTGRCGQDCARVSPAMPEASTATASKRGLMSMVGFLVAWLVRALPPMPSTLLAGYAEFIDDLLILAAFRSHECSDLINRHRCDVGAGFDQLCSGLRLGDDRVDRRVEPRDDVARRTGRGQETHPQREVEILDRA